MASSRPVACVSNVAAATASSESGKRRIRRAPARMVATTARVTKSAAGIEVKPREETQMARALWGMSRSQIANLLEGVTKGYAHTLEIHGVGFRAALKGKDTLQLQVGFSHDVIHTIPAGVDVKVAGAKQEIIEVSGIDKQKVGQMAAVIRASRPPEPYQGKGIRYRGEYIHMKEGKKK